MSQINNPSSPVRWKSNFGFILATAGSAVGLGNIWRFSYLTGENGGAAFLLLYLFFVVVLCLPVMLAEVSLGRIGRADPYHSIDNIVDDHLTHQNKSLWLSLGVLGLATSLIIMFFYPVIGGWVIHYFFVAVNGNMPANLIQAEQTFNGLLDNTTQQIVWHLIFLAITGAVVARGVNKGIEKTALYLMPTLLLLLIVLVIYALIAGDWATGLTFLFQPDFSKINFSTVAQALGQAFFSLSLGIGILITYGAYTTNTRSLTKDLVSIAVIDSSVAILAGIAIFPIVFAIGLEPAAGPALVFLSLPVAFASLPAGWFLAICFFALLIFAAITSAISLLEPSVQFIRTKLGLSRGKSTALIIFVLWLIGLLVIFDAGLIDVFDLISTYLLPLCGIGMCLLVGWGLDTELVAKTLGFQFPLSRKVKLWRIIVKWIAPVVIGFILINAILA